MLHRATPGRAAAPEEPRITMSFDDADIAHIIEAVATATRKTFIIDPRVRAQVTMLLLHPAHAGRHVRGVPVHPGGARGDRRARRGRIMKILPDANMRVIARHRSARSPERTSDEIVTQVIAVKNVSAAQLVTVLRPLIPQQRPPRRLPAGQHDHHFRSRQQREPDHEDHCAHRSGR